MRSKPFFLTPAVLILLLAGCATLPRAKSIMDFTITPEAGIQAGTIVTVNVKTSDDIAKVLGFIDMFGSYKIPLKRDPAKNIWYIKQMVPLGVIIPPGEYLTKVEAISVTGEHYFAEKKIIIK